MTRPKATKTHIADQVLLSQALYARDPSAWRSAMGPINKAKEILSTPGAAARMAADMREELAVLDAQTRDTEALAFLLERLAAAESSAEPEVVR